MTIIFSGTLSNSKAPVDVTIFFSSTFIFGRFVDSDPVAIIILSALIISAFSLFIISISLGDKIFAAPIYLVTLFFLNRKSIPFVSSSTIPNFFLSNFGRSRFTSLYLIPHSPLPSNLIEFSYCSEACNNALDGIHPTFKHVPPRVFRFSTQATLIPF